MLIAIAMIVPGRAAGQIPIRRVAVLTECHNRVCLPFLPESFAPCPLPCLALVL